MYIYIYIYSPEGMLNLCLGLLQHNIQLNLYILDYNTKNHCITENTI
jgi:hypothetical protein